MLNTQVDFMHADGALAVDGAEPLIGVAADYCVRWAIDGLVARGFAIEVPPNLTRGIARQVKAVIADEFAGAPVRLAASV